MVHQVVIPPDRAPAAPPPRRRPWWRSRRLAIGLGVLLVLVVGGGYFVWRLMSAPHPVSVGAAVDRYRTQQSQQPTPGQPAAALPRPASGVYVYTTDGEEGISFGDLTHRYPKQTTVTVTDDPCGLRLRWAALKERWTEWQLCTSEQGWRLRSWHDVHQFITTRDVQDYTCAGDPLVLPVARTQGSWSILCRAAGNQQQTFTVRVVGREQLTLAGKPVTTTRLHVDIRATGKQISDATYEAWVLEPTGLPVRVEVRGTGGSEMLGQFIRYHENARFDLTSATPRR